MQISLEHALQDDMHALSALLRSLESYRTELAEAGKDTTYASHESALATGLDETARERAKTTAKRFGADLRTVMLVGIGGSDLGTRAIYEALHGHLDLYTASHTPRLLSFGTVEPRLAQHLDAILDQHSMPEELALVVVSKSGSTTETIFNANIIYQKLVERFGAAAASSRTVVIGNENAGWAGDLAPENIEYIPMPTMIGGRYSVGTVVGLVPLALLGIDIDAFAEGIRQAAQAAAPADGPGPAAMVAANLAHAYASGRDIHELFLFHPELEMLGKWYRQLLAESVGKTRSDGTRVGIMPSVAIGSTDLHSLGQLIFGGPANRFTSFVTVRDIVRADEISYVGLSPFKLSMLEGASAGHVLSAIVDGVQETYRTQGLPYAAIELETLRAKELGAFMGLHMATVMYLGKLLSVDPFDQPAVEDYKIATKSILTK